MNLENGKKIRLVGFALYALTSVVSMIDFLCVFFGVIDDRIQVENAIDICAMISLGIAALGFYMIWSNERKNVDMAIIISFALSIIVSLLCKAGVILRFRGVADILIGAAESLFYIAIAIKARKYSIKLAAIMMCAYLCSVFAGAILMNLLDAAIYVSIVLSFSIRIIWLLCYIAASAALICEAVYIDSHDPY